MSKWTFLYNISFNQYMQKEQEREKERGRENKSERERERERNSIRLIMNVVLHQQL